MKFCFDITFLSASHGFRSAAPLPCSVRGEPEDRLSLNEMLDRANIAEKSVKSLPGSHMAVYDEKMRSRVVQELAMEAAKIGRAHV